MKKCAHGVDLARPCIGCVRDCMQLGSVVITAPLLADVIRRRMEKA